MRRMLRSSVPVTAAAFIHGLDGVGNGDAGHRRAVLAGRRDGAVDERIAQERPGGIVDEHDFGCRSPQRFQSRANGRLSRRAAETGRRRLPSPAVAAAERVACRPGE